MTTYRTALTEPQRRALSALRDHQGVPPTARDVAMALWPESEGWAKRSSRKSNRTKQGAVGATMPMKAGALLSRLALAGCADELDGRWSITTRGRGVLDGTAEPKPVPIVGRRDDVVRTLKPVRENRGH